MVLCEHLQYVRCHLSSQLEVMRNFDYPRCILLYVVEWHVKLQLHNVDRIMQGAKATCDR